MGNRKNEIFVLMLILAAAITSSCSISLTKNQYYGYPGEYEKPASKKEIKNHCEADTLKNTDNGQNE